VPDVQHTVTLLDHLDRIDYYDPEWLSFHDHGARVRLGWKAIKSVLLWLVKRKHVIYFTLKNSLIDLFYVLGFI
jgi:hypothetical protein